MSTAFVLINAETGAEGEALKGLKEIPEVKKAHTVYGIYNSVTCIQTDTMRGLKVVLSWRVRRLRSDRR